MRDQTIVIQWQVQPAAVRESFSTTDIFSIGFGIVATIAIVAGAGFFQGRSWEKKSTQQTITDLKNENSELRMRLMLFEGRESTAPNLQINNTFHLPSTLDGNIVELTKTVKPQDQIQRTSQ